MPTDPRDWTREPTGPPPRGAERRMLHDAPFRHMVERLIIASEELNLDDAEVREIAELVVNIRRDRAIRRGERLHGRPLRAGEVLP